MRFTSQHLPRLSALALATVLGSAQANGGLEVSGTSTGATVGGVAELLLTIKLYESYQIDGIDFQMDWESGLQFDRPASLAFNLPWVNLIGLMNDPLFPPSEALEVSTYDLVGIIGQPLFLDAGEWTVRLAFVGLQEGPFTVNYSLDLIADQGDTVLDSGLKSTLITISPIPEPTPTALLLGGLAMLGWLAKRRSA